MRPLIIERPELQTPAQRYGYLWLTFACWSLWLYLFLPLLSFLAWAIGAQLVYTVMIQNLQVDELLQLLGVYGAGIGLLATLYLGWAVTSYLRFRDVERRQPAKPVDSRTMARSHHLELPELVALRRAQRLVIAPEDLERMFHPPQDPVSEDAGSRHSDAA